VEPFDFDEPEPEDEWNFAPAEPEHDFVILTCLSDVILPESGEQPEEWLKKLAGQRPVKSFRQIRLVGGFNHKWGLPLPQRWALAMGSVFVFPLSCKPTLEKLVEDGIGERKAEGFGRLAVDWHTKKTLTQRELPRCAIGGSAPRELSPDGKALAQRMANRRLQAELDRWLVRTVNDLTQGNDAFRGLPSATQLSRARPAARRAWMQGNLREFTQHCRNMSKLTQREWDPARLRGDKLGKWIVKQMQTRNAMKLDFEMPVVAGVQAQLTRELRHRTVARLIEGVLRRAVRVARQKAEGGQS
jgi:CRISPR-associated protein Csx10